MSATMMPMVFPDRRVAPSIPLRPYQQEAIDAILEGWQSKDRLLLVLPTGTGKTVVFSEVIKRLMPCRALIVAHRDELIQQAVDKYRMLDPGADIGVVKAERNELHHQIVVASIQTLAYAKRREQVALIPWDVVVIDEAHHATASTYIALIEALGCYEGKTKLLGVTATPNRSDKIGLNNVFETIIYEKRLLDMIRDGYLCDVVAQRVQVPVDLTKVRTSRGDYQQGDLDRAMEEAQAEGIIARAVKAIAPDRKKIVSFTPGVRSAHDLSREFNAVDIPATVVDGETPLMLRREALAGFSKGRYRAIANCGVLTEGYDEPYIDCIVMARPTKSSLLYQQCIGRGTRNAPGKKNVLIIDMVGVTRDHKMVTISSLTGMPLLKQEQPAINGMGGGSGDGMGSLGMSLIDVMRNFGTVVDGDGGIISTAIDLFGNSWANWLNAQGRWVLSLEKTVYVLDQDVNGKWSVWEKRKGETRRLLHERLDLGYAQGIAEGQAKGDAQILTAKDAEWRKSEVTQGQIRTLESFRVKSEKPYTQMTRGEASDAISVAIAMRGWK